MNLFPNGWWPYLAGGLLVGAAVGAIFLLTGLRAGASSVFTTTLSWFTRWEYFQRDEFVLGVRSRAVLPATTGGASGVDGDGSQPGANVPAATHRVHLAHERQRDLLEQSVQILE